MTLQNLGQNFALLFKLNNQFGSNIAQEHNEGLKDIYVRVNNFMDEICKYVYLYIFQALKIIKISNLYKNKSTLLSLSKTKKTSKYLNLLNITVEFNMNIQNRNLKILMKMYLYLFY